MAPTEYLLSDSMTPGTCHTMNNSDFLARHYNAMTDFPGRIHSLTKAIRPWVEDWNVKTALDSGCGGGALLFALDNCGVTPVGLDLSEPMLQLASANARERGKRFPLSCAPHSSAGGIFPGAFDAVFCLGNALIGAADDQEMISSLVGLNQSLRPHGNLLIQILNLAPFFLGLKTLIGRRSVENGEYVRFATPSALPVAKQGEQLTFCAMFLGRDDQIDVRVSQWERWERDRLVSCVRRAGFADVQVFGSLGKSRFNPRCSVDLVIAARHP